MQLKLSSDGLVFCKRCGVPCRASGPGKADAEMLRLSTSADGLCATCAMREWLYTMRHAIPVELAPEQFLIPAIQEQMGRLMKAARADADPSEIKWQKLVDEWDLPIPGAGKGIDRKLRKLDEERVRYVEARKAAGDPMYRDVPAPHLVDMRPAHSPKKRAQQGVGVDDIAQARAAQRAREAQLITPQLHLAGVGARKRLKLRRPHAAPVLRRLATHLLRVRNYKPYPDLLAIVADALGSWAGATSDEARDAVRSQPIRFPPHVQFGGRTSMSVGEVIDHCELAGFVVTLGEQGVLAGAAAAWRR